MARHGPVRNSYWLTSIRQDGSEKNFHRTPLASYYYRLDISSFYVHSVLKVLVVKQFPVFTAYAHASFRIPQI